MGTTIGIGTGKFEAWNSHNWTKLTSVQQVAVNTLRYFYKNPEQYGSPYTERHHLFPKGMGGRPGYSKSWCISLTSAEHLLVHVCLAIILPHHHRLFRAVGMCMIGLPKDEIVLEEILLTAGASDCIAAQLDDVKRSITKAKSEAMKKNTIWRGKKHTETMKAKMREAYRLRKAAGVVYHKGGGRKGQQHMRKWHRYEDNIIAELTVYYRGKSGKQVEWKKVSETALWKSLPNSIRCVTSAQQRIKFLKKEVSMDSKGYWKNLVKKYEMKKEAEKAAHRANFFLPRK